MTAEAAFTHFPSLTTQRLHLRGVQSGDAEALFAIKSNEDVTARYGREPHQTLEDTRAWMVRLKETYARREGLFWCLTLPGDDTAIGSCTIYNIDPEVHCGELGYELLPAFSGKGFMTEAAAAIVAYGFTDLGLYRIEACPLAANLPSRRLLQRLGFIYEGNLRRRIAFRGHLEDQLYFGLLRDEWATTRQAVE